MLTKDLIGAGGGGGSSGGTDFTQTPDNLRSEDLFEGLLGLGTGPWKGLVKGMQSLKINGTPLDDGSGKSNFEGWVANFGNGDPTLWPQKPPMVLGTGASPINVNVPLANTTGTGVSVVRTVPNTGAQFIDIRFIVTQFYHQDKKGIFNQTAHIKVRMKPTGHTGWIDVLLDGTGSEPSYSTDGVSSKSGSGITSHASRSFYQADGSRDTTGIVSGQFTIYGKTTSPAVKELRIAVPDSGSYASVGWDIECTLTDLDTYDNDPISDRRTITWESATAVYQDATLGTTPQWKAQAWLTLYGTASDRINNVPTVQGEYDTKIVSVPPSSVFNPITRRYTTSIWDGSWTKSYTNDPAWVINDALADGYGGVSAVSLGSYLNKWDALDLSKYCSTLVPDGNYNQSYWVANLVDQPKTDVVVALTTNVNISAPGGTLSGVTMSAGMRVLLAGQTTAAQNGIYVWNGASAAMTRATDNDASSEFLGATVYVTKGLYEEVQFKQTQVITTLGTTAVRWVSVHPRYSLNCFFDQPQKADEFIQNLAGAVGAAAWDQGNGEWRCKSDKLENPTAVFTEQNIEGEFTYSHSDTDTRFNDITVTFRNSEFDYREDRVRVWDQANIDTYGRRPTTIVALGCTNRQEAIRRAMLRLRTSLNEFRIVSFRINRQGRFLAPLQNILVADQSLGYTVPTGSTGLADDDERDETTGRILSLDSTRKIITLRDPLRLEPGATYSIVVTVPNPAYTPTPSTAPVSPDWDKPTITQEYQLSSGTARGDVLTLTSIAALDTAIPDYAPIALKATGLPSLPKTYRIVDLTLDDDGERVAVTAVEVDTGKYAAADSADYQSISAQLPDATTPSPTAPTTGVLTVRTFASAYAFNRVLEIDWVRPASRFIVGYDTRYRFNDGPWVKLPRTTDTRIEVPNPHFGIYTVEVVAIDRRGQQSQPLKATADIPETALFGAVGYLTNESQTVPASSGGTVSSYSGASGNFKVFIGSVDVTSGCTFSVISNPGGLTGPYTGSSPVDPAAGSGAYSVTGGLTAASANLTIRATHAASGFTVDKIFTVTKAIAGVSGTAKYITMATTDFAFRYATPSSSAPNTQTTTITANRMNPGSGTTLWSLFKADGTAIVSNQTATQLQTAGYATRISDDQITISHTQFASTITAASTTAIGIRALYSDAATVFDQVTIIKITQGADWSSSVINIPANLAALVGTEAINNQLILSSIAADEILAIPEKQGMLTKLYADLEARYVDLKARALALSLSTTALDAARTDWRALLNSYSPAWNDTGVDTTIYTHLFATRAFPSAWTPAGSTTTGTSGLYTTITDSDAAVIGGLARSNAVAGSTQYSAGVIVLKDNTGAATRFPMLQLNFTGGTTKTCRATIDTATGVAGLGTNCDAFDSLDLGDAWLLWMTATTNSGNTSVAMSIDPAAGANINLSTLNVATTGVASFKVPTLALGDWKKLGRVMLEAKLYAFSSQMTTLAKAISTLDAATSVVIDPVNDVLIYADSAGVVKTGELTRVVNLTASIGTSSVTTLGTWALGTLPAGITATVASGTGAVSITAMTTNDALIPFTFTLASGVVRKGFLHIVRKDDPPSVPSGGGTGGGSGGGTSVSTTTLAATSGTSYGTPASPTLTVKTGSAGQINFNCPINFKRSSTGLAGANGMAAKFQYRLVGSGTWLDVTGGEATSSSDSTTEDVNGGDTPPVWRTSSGILNFTRTQTGLTASTDYEVRLIDRRIDVSGTASDVYKTSGTITATGS